MEHSNSNLFSRLSRRNFLRLSTAASAGTLLKSKGFPAVVKNRRDRKPHIILFMTDQHRWDALGCTGNKTIRTPSIDSIAENGVRFTSGYTAAPSCTPARAGLLTGLSPWHHGMLGYGRVARRYRYELPRMLRQGGYYTFGIGKMHWFPQKTLHGFHGTLVDESGRVETPDFVSDYRDWFKLKAPGLDPDATGIGWNEHRAGVYALPETLHPTYWTGQTAVELLHNYKLDKPLFLKVSFARPHSPYDPPKRFRDLYQLEDIPKRFIGDWCTRFASFPMTKNAAFGDFGEEHALRARQAYYGNVTFIDEQIGAIMDVLKRKGMLEDSLIFFVSDHGDMLGDHYHWRKTYPYEGSAHIPFLMQWPRWLETEIERGTRLAYPVELRDILPTCLDASGQAIPEDMDGRSLLTLVKESNPNWRLYIDMEHAATYRKENYWCALTDGEWKYIYYFSDGHEELFNLKTDPGECHELARRPQFAQELKRWRDRMVGHLSERGEGFVKNGQLQIRKKSLLYSPNYPREDNEA